MAVEFVLEYCTPCTLYPPWIIKIPLWASPPPPGDPEAAYSQRRGGRPGRWWQPGREDGQPGGAAGGAARAVGWPATATAARLATTEYHAHAACNSQQQLQSLECLPKLREG